MKTFHHACCQRAFNLLLLILIPASSAAATPDSFFDGMNEASRDVMETARREIERVRKRDFVVQFQTADGEPVLPNSRIGNRAIVSKHSLAIDVNMESGLTRRPADSNWTMPR